MKYNTPCILYYVDPFIFTIEIVQVDFGIIEEDGFIYYISKEGAYLHEHNLFTSLSEAKGDALKKLNVFYGDKMTEIMNRNPRNN